MYSTQKITLVIILVVSAIIATTFVFFYGNYADSIWGKDTSVISDKELDCNGCNLIIISLTNTRKDHIGIYGYERDTTPNVARAPVQDSVNAAFMEKLPLCDWTVNIRVTLLI